MTRSCTVFVGNIPYDATEDDLRAIFSRAGTVESMRLVYDKDTKQPKGYAFCDYADAEQALNAIKTLTDVECGGRRLRLDLADNALRSRDGGQRSVVPPPLLALPAPEIRSISVASRPQLALPPAAPAGLLALPPPAPAPVGPPMPAGVVPLKPPGPLGAAPDARALGAAGASDGFAASPEAVMAAVSAHTDIAQTVAAMPQAQLQLCLGAMQRLAIEAPENTRALLQDNPQLCYALLHAQLLLGLTLEPALPADEEELQRLRQGAGRGGIPGVVLPPGRVAGFGQPPPPGMPLYPMAL